MRLAGRSVVVTGGGNGIGRALALRFAAAGARGVTVADLDPDWARRAAERIEAAGTPALGVGCDVGDPAAVDRLVDAAEAAFGPVDVFCSNAGYSDLAPADLSQSVEAWRSIMDVNLLAHVWAARRVVPSMVERGDGYLLQTISSAALITGPSAPGYTASKHGALGFAEWLTLNHGHEGVRVTCLCPNAVYTGMFGRDPDDDSALPEAGSLGELLTPEQVADTTVAAMEGAEPFLVLPHRRVGESFLRKATDYDAWLDRTRGRLQRMRATG
ncbi:SDR family NAD(P)-dependent oxidoreductase [Pseudonocardia sp. NPDC049154]|uniref:SDR family NAD(P)-dependent oxidoreductase n=1 Tax=Pseudonocardia sp. NPDC049154 TaxID=3155501 RepID=UPI0033EF7F83